MRLIVHGGDCLQLTLKITLFTCQEEPIFQGCPMAHVRFDLDTHKHKVTHFYIHIFLFS